MTEPGRHLPDELLSAYLDGELSASERAAVEARVASSDAWSVLLDEVREVRAAVRALPMPLAPPGFWESVLLESDAVAPLRRRRAPRRLGLVAGSAAAAIVAVAFVVPSSHRTTPPVATMVDSHASRSSLNQDPITQLAPVAQPVELAR